MDDIPSDEENNDSPLVNLIKTSEREMQQERFEKTTTKTTTARFYEIPKLLLLLNLQGNICS